MKFRVFTLDVFLRSTASLGRRIALILVEGAFVGIGFGIAMFIFPMLQENLREASMEPSVIAAWAFDYYWIIVAALAVHALVTGFLLPRLHGAAQGIWLALGGILPILIVVIPLVSVLSVIGVYLDDLT